MIISFTGPSRLMDNQVRFVQDALDVVANEDPNWPTWRSGCAYGVDTLAAQAAHVFMFDLELYVPGAPHNEQLVEEMLGYASEVYQCPLGLEPYRQRNELMVQGSDKLVAFVRSAKFYRSGEWMTINIARRLNIPVEIKEV
jgi:hypothetical protein